MKWSIPLKISEPRPPVLACWSPILLRGGQWLYDASLYNRSVFQLARTSSVQLSQPIDITLENRQLPYIFSNKTGTEPGNAQFRFVHLSIVIQKLLYQVYLWFTLPQKDFILYIKKQSFLTIDIFYPSAEGIFVMYEHVVLKDVSNRGEFFWLTLLQKGFIFKIELRYF